jgi:hypothetical protein
MRRMSVAMTTRRLPFRTALWAVAGVVAIALGAAFRLTTSSDPDQTSAMTAAQADLLASARFNDYRSGASAIDAAIPVSGQEFTLVGRVDWQDRIGYATLTAAQRQGGGTELLQWTRDGIAVHGNWSGPLPATPPADGWEVRAWQPGADLDRALRLILHLGADHPENAQLLQQGGASVLRNDTIGGEHVTVFAGPPATARGTDSHTRYWIADNGTLRRFEALIDGSTNWAEVDIAPGPAPAVPHIPGMQ